MIAHVYSFENGMTLVFDEQGEQVPEFQGWTSEVMPKIRDAGFHRYVPIVKWPGNILEAIELSKEGDQ